MSLMVGAVIVAQAAMGVPTLEPAPYTPVPTPSYLIAGEVAGFRSRGPVRVGRGSYMSFPDRFDPPDSSHPDGFYTFSMWYNSPKSYLNHQGGGIGVEVEEVGDGTWLQHEVESYAWLRHDLRRGVELRHADGQHFIYIEREGDGASIWVSGGNKAVYLLFSKPLEDTSKEIPEEFLRAYLEKLPSDLPYFEFNDARRVQWIRNEFDRQFYYLDKQIEAWKKEGRKLARSPVSVRLQNIVGLRHRYFAGLSVAEWYQWNVESLRQQYPIGHVEIHESDAEFEREVTELKQWWAAHRNDPIVLPTPTEPPARTPSGSQTPLAGRTAAGAVTVVTPSPVRLEATGTTAGARQGRLSPSPVRPQSGAALGRERRQRPAAWLAWVLVASVAIAGVAWWQWRRRRR